MLSFRPNKDGKTAQQMMVDGSLTRRPARAVARLPTGPRLRRLISSTRHHRHGGCLVGRYGVLLRAWGGRYASLHYPIDLTRRLTTRRLVWYATVHVPPRIAAGRIGLPDPAKNVGERNQGTGDIRKAPTTGPGMLTVPGHGGMCASCPAG